MDSYASSLQLPPMETTILQGARRLIVLLAIFLSPLCMVQAAISVSIGINVNTYPHLVLVPGYPVYYDPGLDANYFFYDGEYWVYDGDNWYSSVWYNGPWELVEPDYVPVFLLRVPVRYYRRPPIYFRAWAVDAPPRWGEHWGRRWEEHRRGWDKWDRRSAPRPAPLPTYQRQYFGNRYPRAPEQQQSIRARSYRYEPRETITKQHFQQHTAERARDNTQNRSEQSIHPSPQQQRQPTQRSDRQENVERQNRSAPAQERREQNRPPPNEEHRRSQPIQSPQQQVQPNREREGQPPPRMPRPERQAPEQHDNRGAPRGQRPENNAPQDHERQSRGEERDRDDRR